MSENDVIMLCLPLGSFWLVITSDFDPCALIEDARDALGMLWGCFGDSLGILWSRSSKE